VDSPDQPSTFTHAQFGASGQQKLGVDQDIAFQDVAVRVREKLDGPVTARILNGRVPVAENALRTLAKDRAPIPCGDFLG
jgi:hypothetical protein